MKSTHLSLGFLPRQAEMASLLEHFTAVQALHTRSRLADLQKRSLLAAVPASDTTPPTPLPQG
jgi:hypothetical protein